MTNPVPADENQSSQQNDETNLPSTPYESLLTQIVAKIQDEPFLFVIAIAALIIGVAVFAARLGSAEVRFLVVVISLLAFAVILGNYIQAALKLQADSRRREHPFLEEGRQRENSTDDAIVNLPTEGRRTPSPVPTERHGLEQTSTIPQRSNTLSLTVQQRQALESALRACSNVQDRSTRDTIVNDLRPEIRSRIKRHDSEKVDVGNIVKASLNFHGGLEELVEIVRDYEGDTIQMQQVDKLLQSYR